MIRISRHNCPDELDVLMVASLTAKYKSTGHSVWNVDYVKGPLLASSNNKCAYCETVIIEESKYMEVEHFRCKRDFPEKVVEWDNLLPSCKRCNGRKGSHNVETDGMIVNPYESRPVDHLYFQNYRMRWRDEIGRHTIDALYLNDTDRMVSVRMKVGEVMAEALEILREKAELLVLDIANVRLKNQVLRGLEKLLSECRPAAQYSALSATLLLSDPNYIWLKDLLSNLDMWADISAADRVAQDAALLR